MKTGFFVLGLALLGQVWSKDLPEKLVENQVFSFLNGSILSRWKNNQSFLLAEVEPLDLVSAPPFLQFFTIPLEIETLLRMTVYDASKKKIISNAISSNLMDYVKWRLTDKAKLTNGLSPVRGKGIQTEFQNFCNTNEVYGRPTPLYVSLKTPIYVAIGSPNRSKKGLLFCEEGYVLVLIKTSKTVYTIKKLVEPSKETPYFPPEIRPLNGREEEFLFADLDGNGTQELVLAANGRPHNKAWTYYNIFYFDDLLMYLKDNKIEPTL